MKSKSDVIVLAEHWPREFQVDILNIPGFVTINHFARSHYIHGGVIILAKQKLAITASTSPPCVEKDFECVVANLEINSVKVFIVAIYRFPGADLDLFFEKLEETVLLCLSKTSKTGQVILCGDLNINFLSNNTNKQRLTDLISSFGIQVVNTSVPTRITATSATAIDYILTDMTEGMFTSQVIDLGISDHCALTISINVQRKSSKEVPAYENKRSYGKSQRESFLVSLASASWSSAFNSCTTESKFSAFMNVFNHHFNMCFPVRHKKSKVISVTITG